MFNWLFNVNKKLQEKEKEVFLMTTFLKQELKYKIETCGHFSYIVALRDIPRYGIHKGDIGAYVDNCSNISQDGDCWATKGCYIKHHARIEGDALVKNDSQIYGHAIIKDIAIIDNSYVYDFSEVGGSSIIEGNSHVFGHSVIKNATIIRNGCAIDDLTIDDKCKIISSQDEIPYDNDMNGLS